MKVVVDIDMTYQYVHKYSKSSLLRTQIINTIEFFKQISMYLSKWTSYILKH